MDRIDMNWEIKVDAIKNGCLFLKGSQHEYNTVVMASVVFGVMN